MAYHASKLKRHTTTTTTITMTIIIMDRDPMKDQLIKSIIEIGD